MTLESLALSAPFLNHCMGNDDCILTDKIYHPCGIIFAISKNVTQDEIDELNKVRKAYFKDKQFDCPPPPRIEDYKIVCKEGKCVAEKINVQFKIFRKNN